MLSLVGEEFGMEDVRAHEAVGAVTQRVKLQHDEDPFYLRRSATRVERVCRASASRGRKSRATHQGALVLGA